MLAETLGLAVSAIEMVAGHGSRDKLVGIPLLPRELADRLARSVVSVKR